MTNTSLRERIGIEEHIASTASRIIRDALVAGLIKAYDPDQAERNARYLRDLFTSIANGHPAKDIDALMPWAYAQAATPGKMSSSSSPL